MNFTKRLLSILIIIFLSINANAQKDTSSRTKVTVFDSELRSPGRQPHIIRDNRVTTQDIIKINPILLLDGDIPVYFERVLNDNISFEIAPGLTYDNYIADLFGTADFLGPNIQDVAGSKPAIGYSFKADIKYFPGDKSVIDGIYLSPEVGYRHYSIDFPTYTQNGTATSAYINGYTNHVDLKLLFGDEEEIASIDNLFIDYYIGIGMRFTSVLQYVPDNSSTTGNGTSASNASYTRPALFAGFKIGIGI